MQLYAGRNHYGLPQKVEPVIIRVVSSVPVVMLRQLPISWSPVLVSSQQTRH